MHGRATAASKNRGVDQSAASASGAVDSEGRCSHRSGPAAQTRMGCVGVFLGVLVEGMLVADHLQATADSPDGCVEAAELASAVTAARTVVAGGAGGAVEPTAAGHLEWHHGEGVPTAAYAAVADDAVVGPETVGAATPAGAPCPRARPRRPVVARAGLGEESSRRYQVFPQSASRAEGSCAGDVESTTGPALAT